MYIFKLIFELLLLPIYIPRHSNNLIVFDIFNNLKITILENDSVS